MTAPTQLVRDALDARDLGPHGPDHKYMARCPAHHDRSPSLSVSEGRDGQALVHCFAGCGFDDVVNALGLERRDLFPQDSRRAPLPKMRPAVRPGDLILRALREHGIGYRCTRHGMALLDTQGDPGLWVADTCPACKAGERWPLWIHVDAFGAARVTCLRGCDQVEILTALAEKPEVRS